MQAILHQMPEGEHFWIPRFALLPLRAEPDHRSEMVSQLLWGEPQELIQAHRGWLQVRGLLDGYIGWVPVGSLFWAAKVARGWAVVRVRWAPLYRERRLVNRVPVGAIFPADGVWHTAGGRFRAASGHLIRWPDQPRRPSVRRTKALFDSVPYLWGGKSPAGVDCSGLVQIAYRLAGWLLPRDAHEQATFASPTTYPQTADLVFFRAPHADSITHVALYHPSRAILHASPANGVCFHPQSLLFTHVFHSYRTLFYLDFVT